MATYSNSQAHKLIACTQTLFSFFSLAPAVNKSPTVFIFLSRALDGLRRQNRGSGNRLTNSHIHTLFKDMDGKVRLGS